MVQVTFTQGTNYPKIRLSVGDYHADIDPESFGPREAVETILGIIPKGDSLNPLSGPILAGRFRGRTEASRDDVDFQQLSQAVDDELEEHLTARQRQYEQDRQVAYDILEGAALEEHLEELRKQYENDVKNSLIVAQAVLDGAYSVDAIGHVNSEDYDPTHDCFLSGTSISRSDGSAFAIEDVSVGDVVQSYDYNGTLVPGRVTRIFSKDVSHVLDFFGTGITPGHVTLCGEGQFAGQHVPIMDILRADGAIVKQDGTLVRAATGCVVGADGDQFVTVILGDRLADGRFEVKSSGRLRLGTRVFDQNGTDVSVLELIHLNGGQMTDDGLIVRDGSDQTMPFVWTFGDTLPKPEDYVLQRSGLSLVDIYEANEWEAAGPRLSHPDAPSIAYSN